MPITATITNLEGISANAAAAIAQGSASATPDLWTWEWGDGRKSAGPNLAKPPMHVYLRGGDYTVRLTVERTVAGNKERGSDEQSITVTAPTDDEKRSPLYLVDIVRDQQFVYYNDNPVYYDGKRLVYTS